MFLHGGKTANRLRRGKNRRLLENGKAAFSAGGKEGKRKKDGYASRNRRIIHG